MTTSKTTSIREDVLIRIQNGDLIWKVGVVEGRWSELHLQAREVILGTFSSRERKGFDRD